MIVWLFVLYLVIFLFSVFLSFFSVRHVFGVFWVCVCVICVCAISGYCLLVICIKTYHHWFVVVVLIMLDHCSHTTRFFPSSSFICSFLFFLRNFKLFASFFFCSICHSFRDRVVMFVISYESLLGLSFLHCFDFGTWLYGPFIYTNMHTFTHSLTHSIPFHAIHSLVFFQYYSYVCKHMYMCCVHEHVVVFVFVYA